MSILILYDIEISNSTNKLNGISIELFESISDQFIEYQFSQSHFISFLNICKEKKIGILQVPQTLFELFYIWKYTIERLNSKYFGLLSEKKLDELFDEGLFFSIAVSCPFMFDYKINSDAASCTLETFDKVCVDQITNQKSYLCFSWFEIMNCFINEILNNSTKNMIPLIIDWDLAFNLLKERITMEFSSSELIRKMKCWPLFHNSLNEHRETDFQCLEKSYFDILKQLESIRSSTSSEPKIILSSEIDQDLFQTFWDSLDDKNANVNNENEITLNTIIRKRDLNPIYNVDKCIYYVTKPNFFDWILLRHSIQIEISIILNEKEIERYHTIKLFYRLTQNFEFESLLINNDNKTTKSNLKSSSILNPEHCHSLSFSSSLFCGIFYDLTACTFWLFWKSKRKQSGKSESKIYVISNLKQISDFIFLPLKLDHFSRMSGLGELFHPRTKVLMTEKMIENSNAMEKRNYFVSGLFQCSYQSIPIFLVYPVLSENEKQSIDSKFRALLKQYAVFLEN